MGALLTALFAKIAAIARWVLDLVLACFKAVFDLLKDLVCWVFDGVLGIAAAAVSVLDFSTIAQWTGLWNAVPAPVHEVLAAIGLGPAFSIIAAAIVIRLTLQLIPFVRLGS